MPAQRRSLLPRRLVRERTFSGCCWSTTQPARSRGAQRADVVGVWLRSCARGPSGPQTARERGRESRFSVDPPLVVERLGRDSPAKHPGRADASEYGMFQSLAQRVAGCAHSRRPGCKVTPRTASALELHIGGIEGKAERVRRSPKGSGRRVVAEGAVHEARAETVTAWTPKLRERVALVPAAHSNTARQPRCGTPHMIPTEVALAARHEELLSYTRTWTQSVAGGKWFVVAGVEGTVRRRGRVTPARQVTPDARSTLRNSR